MILNTISMPYKARPTTKVGNGIEDKKWKLWTHQNKEINYFQKMHIILQGKENNIKFGKNYALSLESRYVI
jgi:hypothetical protein